MSSTVKLWLKHAAHWAVLYGAFGANMDGAMYLLKFFVWLMAPVSLLLLMDKATKDAASKPPRPILQAASALQAWTTLGLLVWFGHIVTALAWALVILMVEYHKDSVKRERIARQPA